MSVWFDPWILIPLLAAAVAGLLAVAPSGRRQLVTSAVAAAALLLLAVGPAQTPGGEATLLLTEGATPTLLAEAGLLLEPARRVLGVGDDPTWPRWIERVADLGAVLRRLDRGEGLQIAGHGLDQWDASRLGSAPPRAVELGPVPDPPAGISHIEWRRDLVLGEPLLVRGSVSGLAGAATLRLTGTGGSVAQRLDSPTTTASFELELVPPGAGRFVFDLSLERSDGAPVLAGRVDIDVRREAPPAVLWLERSPSFEARHVKRWLADAGGAIAVRSAVSRNRSRYEYHNMDRLDLSRLTPETFEPFDVAILDSTSWRELSSRERQLLEEGIRAGELGLVLRLEAGDAELGVPYGMRVRTVSEVDQLMVRPALMRDPPDPIGIPPLELVPSGRPLFTDRSGRVLAQNRDLGRGRLAVTIVAGSYRWVLDGRPDAHRAYWLDLLRSVAPESDSPRWIVPPRPIPAHQPLKLTLASRSVPEIKLLDPAGTVADVAPRQHPTRPDRFDIQLWPTRTGWHTLSPREDGPSISFLVGPSGSFAAWQLTRRRDATALAALERSSTGRLVEATPLPWLRLVALLGLVVALSLAWIEERSR